VVLAPLWSPRELSYLARYALGAFGLKRSRVPGLLDPTPLTESLARLIPFERIGQNIDRGALTAAAVVATSALTSRSVVFHQGGTPRTVHDHNRGIDYAPVTLTAQHVRASAAIPAVFPAVHVDDEPGRGWYFDGGTRLNTPIKPALSLGADRVIAIGLNSIATGPDEPLAGEDRPDLFAGAGELMVALLATTLAHDVQTLAKVNSLVDAQATTPGRQPVPYIFIAPEGPYTIGRIAAEVYRDRYRAKRGRGRSLELALLGRAVEGDFDAGHGELLSYLFFDPDFCAALIEQGKADGERWVQAAHDDGLWQVGPLPR
jgi:NTE family protein